MDFFSLVEYCQLKAIEAGLDPSWESIYRIKCREYSTTFHTPLHIVQNELDPMIVLQALYEPQYSPSAVNEEVEEILERLYSIKDPNYTKMSKEEIEELVDAVMTKEIKRMGKKKRPTQETIQTEIKKEALKPKPKSGSMSFGDLEKLESKVEAPKSGFKD